jgi:hypothetical protein
VENAKCLENKTFTYEGVGEEITGSLRSARRFYLLGMYILWKWQVVILRKIYLFKSYYVCILTHGIEMLVWNKGYNSIIIAEEEIYKK